MNKERREIAYSITIIIVIPLLIAINTIWLTQSVRGAFDTELRRKADLANAVVAEAVQPYITSNQTSQLQALVTKLHDTRPELRQIMVTIPQGNEFAIVAKSADAPQDLRLNDTLQMQVVMQRKQSTATFVNTRTDEGQSTRAWNVATPVFDSNQNVAAVIRTNVLTTDADELIDATFFKSFLLVTASIVVTVALLFHHFRLVGYADLLRRQREINQTMSDFLSVATHELKAPMSIIKGYIANVVDGTFGTIPARATENLNTALAQTDRLNHLVQDLLNVSHIDQGRISFEIQPVAVPPVVQTLLKHYHDKAAEKHIELVYSRPDPPAGGLPAVNADPGRLQEILTNLIDNAIKYSVVGTVTISHKVKGNMVATMVRDTGIGLSSEERERLFQRFYRARNEKTKDISGTGLGLWIIKQYVEKMGGKIEVDSLVGVGTEFTVYLPISRSNSGK